MAQASGIHICHIITRLIVGGAQENTILTCRGLHERGRRVTLITGPEAGPEGQLLDEARATGYDVIVLPSLRRAVNPLADRQAYTDLVEILRQIRPDIVHTHSSKAGIIGRFAARAARVPIVVHTIHGMSFNRTQSWMEQSLYRFLEQRAARITDCLVTVADAMIDQATEAGIAPREKFRTVYSGMEVDWFSPDRYDRAAIRASWGFSDEHVVVGAIARLFRNKGYEKLIPAMADAARRNPALRFVWVGDGAQRTEYEEELEYRGLRDRTHLTGLVPPNEVARMAAGMDILVHASQWEGLPRAAVQALLMEVPVISFDIDGAPEVVIPGQTGMLVPLNDVDALADAMVELAADPQRRRRFGQAGRQTCLQHFDWRYMVDQLDRIYGNLLAARR
ncbi:MAG TPA: glycosyltransferase family 4 protein [Phycisphaerae bacterium]|mgnify:CR=1 FL=1|nr:glycosyltransferase family 4 protein [Phycisphaerae bacterium]HOJ75840.1 glycosyltransferase family 4 protein [Phycisphaerae bacterium]HOM53226.1 glycosyltransferase family 4 protein [Phycisphaerae bacterium]HON68097.1 glycosyltransferase family 4 protein [Phycisphaerae bacterium]HOQ86022.1 glycosyltransferase family 4 protein [Phycisphaerae bacterium]